VTIGAIVSGYRAAASGHATPVRAGLLVVVAAAAVLAAASPVGAASPDPRRAVWQGALQVDMKRYPRVTRAALARVPSQPLFARIIFVSGAIGGKYTRAICSSAKAHPADFEALVRKRLFSGAADRRYIASRGWTVAQVVALYRRGVVFGCDFA
jgi:hypothetical protein